MHQKIDLSRLPICQEQAWKDMPRIPGGRLCEACSRCIVDMREKSPLEIARAFTEANGPLCGAYTPGQLTNPQLPVTSQPFAKWLGALGVGLLGWVSNPVGAALPPVPMHQLFPPGKGDAKQTNRWEQPPVVQDTIFITGQVIDTDTKEGLPFANVLLKGTELGTTTDFDGNFRLAVAKDQLGDERDLVLKYFYVGYEPQEVRYAIDASMQGVIELNVRGALKTAEIISFGVVIEPPTPMNKVKWFFRRINPFKRRS